MIAPFAESSQTMRAYNLVKCWSGGVITLIDAECTRPDAGWLRNLLLRLRKRCQYHPGELLANAPFPYGSGVGRLIIVLAHGSHRLELSSRGDAA